MESTLAKIIENAESIKKKYVRESIIRNRERLLLNRRLIKLEGMNEIPFELDEMKYEYNGITTTEVLRGIGLKS